MDSKLQQIGMLVSTAIQESMKSGLTWDGSVAAFGMAPKALADRASIEGDGTPEDCQSRARKRFEEGFAQLEAAWRLLVTEVIDVTSNQLTPTPSGRH